jgi:hypothetical protein
MYSKLKSARLHMSYQTLKRIFYAVAALFLFLACGIKEPEEKEPNNTFSAANEIEINGKTTGYINSLDDRDFFKLAVTEPAIVDITLGPVKGVNHAFEVWKDDENPVVIKLIDDNRKSSPERMSNLYVEPGIYYICVMHGERDTKIANSDDPYTISLEERQPYNEEHEPNDSYQSATAMEADLDATGFFSPAYNRLDLDPKTPMEEDDWFSFTVEARDGEQNILDIGLSEVPGVNSFIKLFDSGLTEIAGADFNPPVQGKP